MPVNREAMEDSYQDVRDDNSETTWATYEYVGKTVEPSKTGSAYEDMLAEFGDDKRVYAYVRFETGDELSKRAKFAVITWIGPAVGALKKATMSTDKGEVKRVLRSFAVEILADSMSEVAFDTVLADIKKAGGANYGDGTAKE